MRAKSTLEKALKFVHNCKFIFSFKKNIFQKNIFSALLFLILFIFSKTENVDSYLTNLENPGQNSELFDFKDFLTDKNFSVNVSSANQIDFYDKLPTCFAGVKKKGKILIL